jgi:hypothetical protein
MTAALWTVTAVMFVAVPRWFAVALVVAWLDTVATAVAVAIQPTSAAITLPDGLGLPMTYVGGYPIQYAVVIASGLLAVLASATVHWRPSGVERSVVAVGIVAATVDTLLIRSKLIDAGLSWTAAARLTPLALLAAGVVVAIAGRRTEVIWASLLLLVPAPLFNNWFSVRLPSGLYTGGSGPHLAALDTIVEATPLPWFDFRDLLPAGAQLPVVVCLMFAAMVIVAVTAADAYRRSALPRDGRSALAVISALALGSAGALCAYLLVNTVWRGLPPVDPPEDLAALVAPMLAAFAVPLVPARLRRPTILLALAVVLTVAYTGRARIVLPEFFVVVVLLLVVALAQARTRWRLVAAGAVGAVALLFTVDWLTDSLMGGGFWPPESGWVQRVTGPTVGAVVLPFALWWAPVVIVRAPRIEPGALLAFAAGLVWLALQLELAGDTPLLVAGVLGALAVAVAVRFVLRRPGRTVAPG